MYANNTAATVAIIDAVFANNAVEQVEFKPEYHNGTGYFDPITKIDLGSEIVKMVDENGRRIVVIPCPRQNVVLNERYRDDQQSVVIHCHKSDVVAGYDASKRITHTYNGAVERDDLTDWLNETAEFVGATP